MLADLVLPVPLETRIGAVTLRRARSGDAAAIIALLADDPVSASRGDVAAEADLPAYTAGLESVLADASNDLLVAEHDGRIVGTFQLTRIPGMSRRGATRLLVEAVRVRSDLRSAGIGSALMRWTTDVAAPALGTSMVQLTSDARRVDAHRFYERLGFVGSHRGFKFRVPRD
ncbi:GNAT family N-acetyltransferase [Microbacterium capsulatum]|uniref:GNAT family N-acetyltransferase n=1 Tax=Microbacterium capsulatum TaxID=3041921 RepID=A0ABU0XKI0_9MICO|nr:GNAT family N-acetyltransferase [Microbacterium sp. ASV81]MDQ4215652.1 GNAT family N-acetyltransferase [Microbacterium sp. ASV81]